MTGHERTPHKRLLWRLSTLSIVLRTEHTSHAQKFGIHILGEQVSSPSERESGSLLNFLNFLPPEYTMGGGGDTKKSLEDVKADLAKELADNARALLKSVIHPIPSRRECPTDSRVLSLRISTSPTTQLTSKLSSTSLRSIGSSRRTSMISVKTRPR